MGGGLKGDWALGAGVTASEELVGTCSSSSTMITMGDGFPTDFGELVALAFVGVFFGLLPPVFKEGEQISSELTLRFLEAGDTDGTMVIWLFFGAKGKRAERRSFKTRLPTIKSMLSNQLRDLGHSERQNQTTSGKSSMKSLSLKGIETAPGSLST